MTEWRFTDVEVFDLDNVIFTSSQCNDNVCSGDIVKTTNRGQNWTSVINNNGYYTSFSWINNQTGWAVANFWNDVPPAIGMVVKTNNGGQNWDTIFTAIDTICGICVQINNIQFFDANTGYLTINRMGYNSELCKTNDGGNNWFAIDTMLNWYTNFHFLNKDTGWIIGYISGGQEYIKRTYDGGQSWEQQPIYVSGNLWKTFFANSDDGWLIEWTYASGSKIHHTTNGGIMGVKLISTNTPDEFRLLQNFPNPFNPTTTIRYDIKTKGNVELKVFDLLGREITTLVNESQTPGTYEVVFDASTMPSGVYYYKMQAGD